MADITRITVGGTTYNLRDEQAIALIEVLQNSLTGGMRYIGTALQFAVQGPVYIKTGNDTIICYYTGTQPTLASVTIQGVVYQCTYKKLQAGYVTIYGESEYVFSDADNLFHEFGSTGSLKALAFKDNASGTYKRTTKVTTTLNKTNKTLTPQVTQGTIEGTGKFTPAGTITQGIQTKEALIASVTPTTQKMVKTSVKGVNGQTQASKASVNSFEGISANVSGETLILTNNIMNFTDVAVPIANTNATDVATGEISATGTGGAVVTSVAKTTKNAVTNVANPTFAGTEGNINVTGATKNVKVGNLIVFTADSATSTITETDQTITVS